MSEMQKVFQLVVEPEAQQSKQYVWKTIVCTRKDEKACFKGQCFWCIEKLGLCFSLEHSDKVKDKSPHRMWLTLMPFDASDMFVKPKIRLCIEVIIFQFFVWKITELMVFFSSSYCAFHIAIAICCLFFSCCRRYFTYHLLYFCHCHYFPVWMG
ncbi:hypothetical protein H1C71_014479 [Ictidomys tridecemlineatus]|nr:hypothetical protein H1C71_014479 [Ictidomys tridecemlineatus]